MEIISNFCSTCSGIIRPLVTIFRHVKFRRRVTTVLHMPSHVCAAPSVPAGQFIGRLGLSEIRQGKGTKLSRHGCESDSRRRATRNKARPHIKAVRTHSVLFPRRGTPDGTRTIY